MSRLKRAFLFVFLSSVVYAENPWFPVGGSIFPKLLADPEEVQTTAKYFRLHGEDIIDFSVGNNWGIRRWEAGPVNDWAFQLDISGVIIPRFKVNNMVEMEAVDYIVNLPLEIRHVILSARISPFHQSAHLGDNFIQQTGQQRIGYSREGVQSVLAVDPFQLLRVYAGATQLLHTVPDVGRTTVQGGLELRSPTWQGAQESDYYVYLAQDEQAKEEVNWDVNSDTQLGVAIGFRDVPRKFRIYANYFTGHSTFGQFYREKESLLGVGIGFDF